MKLTLLKNSISIFLIDIFFLSLLFEDLFIFHFLGLNLNIYDPLIFIYVIYYRKVKIPNGSLFMNLFILVFLISISVGFLISILNGIYGGITLFFQGLRSVTYFYFLYFAFFNCGKSLYDYFFRFRFYIIFCFLSSVFLLIGFPFEGTYEKGDFGLFRHSFFVKDPNFLLIILSPIYFSLIHKKAWFYISMTLIIAVATFSRSLLFVYLLILILSFVKNINKKLLILILLIFVYLIQKIDFSEFSNLMSYIDRFSSGSPRFLIWEALYNDFWNNNLLFGSGLRSAAIISFNVGDNPYPHSTIVETLYEQGLFGLFGLLILFIGYIQFLYKNFNYYNLGIFLINLMGLFLFTYIWLPIFWFFMSTHFKVKDDKYSSSYI
jgi:hypothetical protein